MVMISGGTDLGTKTRRGSPARAQWVAAATAAFPEDATTAARAPEATASPVAETAASSASWTRVPAGTSIAPGDTVICGDHSVVVSR